MSNLSQERRALFQRARQDFEPTGNERERNARAVAARLGVSAAVLAGTLSTASASAAGASIAAGAGSSGTSLALLTGKWLAVGLLVSGSVVAGAVAAHVSSAPAPSSVPSAASALTRSSPALTIGARSMLEVERAAPATPAPTTRPLAMRPAEPSSSQELKAPSTPPFHSANVTEEARLVRRAQEALHTGSASNALVLLDQLTREQPNGVLMEERSVERIDSLCQLGRTGQARAEAIRFLRATPSSPLAKRVQQSCAAPLTTVR